MERQSIRIAILHGNRLFRECLGCCLEHGEPISIVHSASSLEGEGEILFLSRPDLVILDYGWFCLDGTGNSRVGRSLSQELKTLAIEVPETEDAILSCINVGGASGYLLVGASIRDLVDNVKTIMRRETLCSPKNISLDFCRVSRLAPQIGSVGASNGTCLTRREREIMGLIDNGLSNKEIAVRLQIEVSTVKNHVHNILDKLQLHDRRSAVKHIKDQSLPTSPL